MTLVLKYVYIIGPCNIKPSAYIKLQSQSQFKPQQFQNQTAASRIRSGMINKAKIILDLFISTSPKICHFKTCSKLIKKAKSNRLQRLIRYIYFKVWEILKLKFIELCSLTRGFKKGQTYFSFHNALDTSCNTRHAMLNAQCSTLNTQQSAINNQ